MYSGYSLKRKKKKNLLSSSSGSQKAEAMSYWAMIKVLAGGSGGESISLPFTSSRGHPHALESCPFLHLHSVLFVKMGYKLSGLFL